MSVQAAAASSERSAVVNENGTTTTPPLRLRWRLAQAIPFAVRWARWNVFFAVRRCPKGAVPESSSAMIRTVQAIGESTPR